MSAVAQFRIPALVPLGGPLRPLRAGESAGGWAVFGCYSAAQVKDFMAAYPQASMPCWRRPIAAFEVAS